MEQSLKQLLLQTTSPHGNIRNNAEMQLKNLEKSPDFLNVIRNVLMRDQDKIIQQISSIYFMNAMERNWKDKDVASVVADLENSILQLLTIDDKYPRMAYQKLLHQIFENSERETILRVFKASGSFLGSTETHQSKAALILFEEAFKSDSLRFNMEDILGVMFNELGGLFVSRFSEFISSKKFSHASHCMKIVSKAYSNYTIPDFLNGIDVFTGLFNMAIRISEVRDGNSESLLKTQRWAIFFLYKVANKGMKKYFKNPDLINFVRKDEILQTLYSTFTNILNSYLSGVQFHEKVASICSDFFKLFASNKRTKHFITENYMALISSFIIPTHSYTDDVKDSFECDPENYLRERYNYFDSDLKSGTLDLFDEILRDNKEVESNVILPLKSFLDIPVDVSNAPTRYAVIGLLANSQKSLIRILSLEGFNSFLERYIFPELNSSFPFLVSQALYFLSFTESIETVNSPVHDALNRTVMIINTGHDVLSVEACLALNPFIYCEHLHAALKPVIPSFFEKVLLFSKKYFLESLTTLCNSIIDCFTDEISAYAPVFVQSICASFMAHIDSDKDENVPVISGYLSTIEKLVMTSDDKPEIIRSIYHHASGIIGHVFRNHKSDFFQECFDLMNSFLFVMESINESMFEIFALALSNEADDLCLFPHEISDFIDNYLSYGKDRMITPMTLELIYKCIDIFMPMNSTDTDVYDEDLEAACKIIDSLMLNCGHSVHRLNQNIIPALLHKIISNYDFISTYDILPLFAVESIMNCFIVAPEVTLVNLSTFTEKFFMEIDAIGSKFTRVYDKKLFLLFAGQLFKVNAMLPINYESFCEVFVSVITTLPAAITLRNKLKEKADNDDYDEDDSDYTAEDLYEDIYFETILDKFDAYKFTESVLNSIQPNTIGQKVVSAMTTTQIARVKDILENPQEEQK